MLRARLIRLAYARPELRSALLPLLRTSAETRNPSPEFYNSAVISALAQIERNLPSLSRLAPAWIELAVRQSGLPREVVVKRIESDADYLDGMFARFYRGLEGAVGQRSEETFRYFQDALTRANRETGSGVRLPGAPRAIREETRTRGFDPRRQGAGGSPT